MNSRKIVKCLAVLLFIGSGAHAQSNCGLEHPQLGAFICYPDPASHPDEANLPDVFHLSAQANAPAGRKIRRYTVLLDGYRVYENRLSLPVERISIETNITSPYSSGQHKLGIVVDGAGSAETSEITFHRSTDVGFCDQFSRVNANHCVLSRAKRPLDWSVAKPPDDGQVNAFSTLTEYLSVYSQNLKSLEADVAEAAAVDSAGNLYTASHSFADIELRKYSRRGSLIYDTVVRSQKPGFVSIQGMAVNDAGRTWVIGNTAAVFATTSNALVPAETKQPTHPKGFAMSIDTSNPGSQSAYFTYISTADNYVRTLRVDADGNAYIAGSTTSMSFPHESVLRLSKQQTNDIGFISVLNPSGSSLKWSSLLIGAGLNGLAIGRSGTVYVAGHFGHHTTDKIFVAVISNKGRKLSYVAHFDNELRVGDSLVISVNPGENLAFVTGAANSGTTATAVQIRRHGIIYSQILRSPMVTNSPEIAFCPALDAFAAASGAPLTSNGR